MGDAKSVFDGGTEAKRNMLKQLWPELYDALADLDKGGAGRAVYCVVGGPEHVNGHHPAVGRLGRMGHPVCAEHVRLAPHDIWPLPAAENRRKGER